MLNTPGWLAYKLLGSFSIFPHLTLEMFDSQGHANTPSFCMVPGVEPVLLGFHGKCFYTLNHPVGFQVLSFCDQDGSLWEGSKKKGHRIQCPIFWLLEEKDL